MKNATRVGLDRKHEKVKHLDMAASGLFGFAENTQARTENSSQAFRLHESGVNETPKDYVMRAEREKANALIFVQRKQLIAQ